MFDYETVCASNALQITIRELLTFVSKTRVSKVFWGQSKNEIKFGGTCTGKLKLDTKMWGLYSSIVVNCTNRHSVLDTEVTSEIYKAGAT